MARSSIAMLVIVAILVVFGPSTNRAPAALVDRLLLHMDEGSGVTTEDDTSVENVCELGGHGCAAPTWAPGKFGGALQFNPDEQKSVVWCNSDPSLNVTEAMTLEAWVYRNDAENPTGYNPIALRGDYGSTGFWFAILSSGKLWVKINGASGSTNSTSSAVIPAAQWHHVAMTYTSGSGGSLYIDGVSKATLANVGDIKWITATKDTTAWPLTLGADPNPDGYVGYHRMDGLIDEFAMYGHALTPEEILARATGGPPTSVPEPSSLLLLTAGLVGFAAWRLGGSPKRTRSPYAAACRGLPQTGTCTMNALGSSGDPFAAPRQTE